MDTSGFKAIVEMAEMIKNPKALQEAAAVLAEGFKLSDEEIKKRDEYNTLLQKAAAVQAENAALIASNQDLLIKIETARNEQAAQADEDKNLIENERRDIRLEKENLADLNCDLKARETEVIRMESEYNLREKAIIAKENELRAREAGIEEREARMKKVMEAMG